MELALCSTCQTLRRVGKRFVVSKLSNTSQTPKDQKKTHPAQYKCLAQHQRIVTTSITSSVVKQNLSLLSMRVPSLLPCERSIKSLLRNTQSFAPSTARHLHTIVSAPWIDQEEIEGVLKHAGLPFKKRYAGYITTCNCCVHQNSDEHNLTMFINARNGNSVCRSCGKRFDWATFKKMLQTSHQVEVNSANPVALRIEESNHCMFDRWMAANETTQNQISRISESFIGVGNLQPITFELFQVKVDHNEENSGLIFPYFDITKSTPKSFKIYENSADNSTFFGDPGELSMFGWNLIKDTNTTVIITANEFDCLAISQATNEACLCLPHGASSLPLECLPYLEQFDHVTFWFGNDYQAKQNLHRFASKLGLSRCSFISTDGGAYDILCNHGEDFLRKALHQKHSLSHDNIVTFKELSSELYSDLINTKRNAGVPFVRFPVLNEYLRGHRRGELTIFTGPTGSGKTTFLSELSLDLCIQGVRTLWGSFEIKNVRLINIMIHQYTGLAIENYLDKFSKWSEEFENLPMYFMNYYGSTQLNQVIETVKYAVYTYDIEHIVIDNLQFMTTVSSGEDRFQLMDRAIAAFRKCASDLNVHITVVVHPRKENDGSVLQTASIYGSAKASQEADNVLILQNSEKLSMQVSKNRFSGTVGTIPLSFHPDSLCLSGFHRNPNSNEPILPVLKVKRPVQKLKVFRKPKEADFDG